MISSPSTDELMHRARRLGLNGLVAHWQELGQQPWVPTLLDCEDQERQRRSLQRRLRNSKVGHFKSIADFDWSWPTKIDRPLIEELLQLGFMEEAANVVFAGPGGVGKTMIGQNMVHLALVRGYSALSTSASEMPVLPLDDSTSVMPGRSDPSRSAASTIAAAIRSFTEPQGLNDSSLARISTPGFRKTRWRRTRGVRPIVSRMVVLMSVTEDRNYTTKAQRTQRRRMD